MTTLPNMGLQLPVRGSPGSGQWGDTLDADITLMDAHSHEPGLGVPIVSNALNIDGDISFSALYAPTNLNRISFSRVSPPIVNLSVFVGNGGGGTVTGELYYRNGTGNNIKVTAGNALNVAAFTGGIGGDYTAVAASVIYDDALKRYKFQEGTADSNGWARMYSGEVRILPTGGVGTNYVGMAAPGALAAPYTVTWPLTLPGSGSVLQVDATGQIAASNTLAINQSITVSGTGSYKHGTFSLQLAAGAFAQVSTAGAVWATSGITGTQLNCIASIPLTTGDRITGIRVYIQDNTTPLTKMQVSLVSTSSTGAVVTIASTALSAGTGTNQTMSIAGLTSTVAATLSYSIFVISNNTGTTKVYMAEVDYDR